MSDTQETVEQVEQVEHKGRKAKEIHYNDIKSLLKKNENELEHDERKMLMKYHYNETQKFGEEAHTNIIKMALPIIVAQNGRYVQTKDLIDIGKKVLKTDGTPVGDKGNVRHVLQAHGLHPLVRIDSKIGWTIHMKRLNNLCTEHNVTLSEDFKLEPIVPKASKIKKENNDQKRLEKAAMKKVNEAIHSEIKQAKTFINENDLDKALEIYNKILAEYPSNEQALKGIEKVEHKQKQNKIKQHITKATEMLKNENFDEANNILRDILELDKNNKFAAIKMKYIESIRQEKTEKV